MVQLDGLRGLAALAVVIQHTWNDNPISRINLGSGGVRLFFVLSGFLITGILIRAREEADRQGGTISGILRAFHARRALRIFPLYYAAIAFAAILGLPTVRESLGWHLSYLTNIQMARLGVLRGPFTPHWSLAVEEQFYVLWPAFALLLPARSLKPILVGCIVLGPLSRLVVYRATGNVVAPDILLPCCLDTLGAGALLAIRRRERGSGEPNAVALLVAGSALLAVLLTLKFFKVGGVGRLVLSDSAWMLLATWLVDRAASGFRGVGRSVLEAPAVVGLGAISYGIYVYHNLVIQVCHSRLPGPGAKCFLVVILATIPLAILSWRLYERPLNRLKGRFPYVQPGSAARDRDNIPAIGWAAIRKESREPRAGKIAVPTRLGSISPE